MAERAKQTRIIILQKRHEKSTSVNSNNDTMRYTMWI